MKNKMLQEVVIVAYGRSAIGRGYKGSLKSTHPVDLAGLVLKGVLDKLPELDKGLIEDVIIGCTRTEGMQGLNLGRLIALRAGLPISVPGQTVNRFCSSGLQAISTAANMIATGQSEVMVAGGVEMMSHAPKMTEAKQDNTLNAWLLENEPDVYMPMGLTAEKVAKDFNVSREEMDQLAVDSHKKAFAAQQAGKFDSQIIPIEVTDDNGNKVMFGKDEGIRKDTNLESLSKLVSPFMEGGSVTAATSSQVSDGTGMVVLMSADKAKELGIKPLAKFVGFAVAGVEPGIMGIGPIAAVPKMMKLAGLTVDDMDVIEINEAFAAQAIPCIKTLKLDMNKVNPNGGAMALGHPLGATGAILTCKALSELERINGKYALITMCIGGGMGAAGIIEKI